MKTQILFLGAAAALYLAACGDDETGDGTTGNTGNTGNVATGGTGNTGGSSGGTGNTGGSTGGTGGGAGPDCEQVCTDLYGCGSADNNALCPGFADVTEADFVAACIPTCESNAALAAVVDPDNCETTITLVKSDPDFTAACEGAGGAGGGG